MNIQQEFRRNYPQLVYLEHKYLENAKIGVSFLHVCNGRIYGGVRVFNIKDGSVQWETPLITYRSWADVNQKER